MTALPYASTIERRIATAIVKDALAAGYTVSVYDGEEWAIKSGTNAPAILAAMGSTDMDTLRLRRDGENVGSIVLIWGNEEDLLSDHTDTEELNVFVQKGKYH